MCGFIGFVGNRPPLHLQRGAEFVRRRGPDSMGTWAAATGHVHLMHARLSISDLRLIAMQPMSDPASGLTVAFAGEIYNHLELRQTLPGPFRTQSDTETLLRLFDHLDTRALPLLRGMYALTLVDERRRRVLLVRDPVGKKPLFMLQRPEGTYFGNSVLALAAASGHTAIDDAAADQWMDLGYPAPDQSLLAGCRPILPGEVVELGWDGSVVSRSRAAPAELQPVTGITLADAVDHLEALLRTSVKRRLADNPNPVALLSGGIDSTIVCKYAIEAGATRLLLSEPRLFRSHDGPYAREAAERLGVPLEIVSPNLTNVRSMVERAVQLHDEPLGMISFIPLAMLAEQAANGSRVLLTGDGGDEVFGGYGQPRDWIAETPHQSDCIRSGPTFPDWLSDYGRRAGGFELVGHGMAKVDRATAEQALEARCPLLDWDVQAFVRSLPRDIVFFGSTSKPLAKALLRGWPHSFLERTKAGFPFRLRGLWSLSMYSGLSEAIDPHAVARFQAKLPAALRKPPESWSLFDIAQHFVMAYRLYVWSAFVAKLQAIDAAALPPTVAISAPPPSVGPESGISRLIEQSGYLISSVSNRVLGGVATCPSCGSREFSRVDQRFVVTTLERCHQCRLMFRLPHVANTGDSCGQHAANCSSAIEPTPPDIEVVELMKDEHFKGTKADAGALLELLAALGCDPASTHVLDYGCSWGYTAWQFQAAGYRLTGYEPRRNRCDFAVARMGIAARHRDSDLVGPFDVLYCSGLLTHVANVRRTMERARSLVRPGGWIIYLTPNGSEAWRQADPRGWSRAWGKEHANLLDDTFYKTAAGDRPLLLTTAPFDRGAIARWTSRRASAETIGTLAGPQLLAVLSN